jgi:hypothetical protein
LCSAQELTPDEFRLFLGSLKLELTEQQMDELTVISDVNGDGVVVRAGGVCSNACL